jgi:hypothetical protein
MDFLPDCGPSCGGNQGQAIMQGTRWKRCRKIPGGEGGGEGGGGEERGRGEGVGGGFVFNLSL